MKATFNGVLRLAGFFAAAFLLFDPLHAEGPCFEVAPMTTTTAMRNAYPGAPRKCESCECHRDRVCPCGLAIVNIYRGTVPTARYCTNRGWRCADDFDLVREADGKVKQVRCGLVQACNDVCVPFKHNGRTTGFVCTPDGRAQKRAVHASVYTLTGKPCPHG